MARPRTPIGTYGTISIRRQPSGRYAARTRYRDWDGKSRLVQVTGLTRAQAQRVLKAKLADRSLFHPVGAALSPDSPFPELVVYWLEDLELEGRIQHEQHVQHHAAASLLAGPFLRGASTITI